MCRSWTKDDIRKLKKLYPYYKRREINRDDLEKALNRTIASIYTKATLLNITNENDQSIIDEKLLKQIERRIKL